MCLSFWTKEQRGIRALRFPSENGYSQAVRKSRSHRAGKLLLGNPETV